MGCDKHLYVERRRNINNKDVWFNCDNWRLNPYHDEENEPKYEIAHLYDDRNYRLFSVLAGVRNYSENEPIAQPRGLPSDVSDATKAQSDHWDGDGHTHSWFTLKEVKDYFAKHPKVKYSGIMTPENAAKVDAGEMPYAWCQGSTDTSLVHREWEFEDRPLKRLISLIDERKRDEFRVFGDDEGLKLDAKIRIVFWFDN